MSTKFYTIGGHTISYGGFLLREAGAGALTITKTVTGSGFDPAKAFELTVTFDKPVTYNGTTSTTHTFNLASGQSVTITGIPEATAYSVEEAPLSPADIASGYSFEGITDGSGTIPNGQVHAIAINGYGGLSAKTLRLLYPDGVTPIFTKGTGTQMSSSPNVWDLHYDNPDWSELLRNHEILKVLGAGDTSGVTNMHHMFYHCLRLNEVHLFNTSGVTNMKDMFAWCRSLTTVPLFDTSACTDMSGMFSFCTSLASVPLFDTSNVTDMRGMFADCYPLTSVPLFDTSNVTDMGEMFARCTSLPTVPSFDTSNVTDMSLMFFFCRSLTSVPWFDTSNVTDMGGMFDYCDLLTAVPLFDTSNVTDMGEMFDGCASLISVPLFNTGNVTNMRKMFFGCTGLTAVPLFNTHACEDMCKMFILCSNLTAIPLFDTSACEDMDGMFASCTNVGGGALALYQQASEQAVPPVYHSEVFRDCGIDTTTGAAELAQIPSDWK